MSEDEKPSVELQKAFVARVTSPLNRSYMRVWCEGTSRLDAISAKVIMQVSNRLRGAVSADQLSTALSIIDCLARGGARDCVGDLLPHLKSKMDGIWG